ncbi:MAG TPA: metallopeptidase TldD-related protein [Candidatus Acidoferrales bacterium]|nr:metallopeptidase TldD-related protein [Candidatus Acidoferrales bacterium]
MKKPARFALLGAFLAATLTAAPALPPRATARARTDAGEDRLLDTMQTELKRAAAQLSKSDPPAYFLSYSTYDGDVATLSASYGSLQTSFQMRFRRAGVIVRVGSPELDNTHGQNRRSGIVSGALPLEDDVDALARSFWWLTNRGYRSSAPAFLRVKTDTAVRSEEEDKSPDFSAEPPQVHVDSRVPPLGVDLGAWTEQLRRDSAWFRQYPEVYDSVISLQAQSSGFRFTSSEGSRIAEPSHLLRLVVEAMTRADDGMELIRVETWQAPQASDLPSEAVVHSSVDKIAADLKALRAAPVAEPFAGPALLSGRAAAVFFHEVLGHRLEGHRQRDEEEGQTFTKKVGQQVMPTFLSVVDDPTLSSMAGEKLSGSYAFDDEGQPAERVELIQDGVLKNFLMSRMPIKGFGKSNGHGRAQPGLMATGRQGNLIVTSTNTISESELRQRLIDEVKKQGKPYGLYFEDVQGGFTLTQRGMPQAFQVLPVIVWRVYADGRPDELVRGVDIVGTPLAALNRILVTGDKMHVFNGICGAESGSVPVSAVAPAMLFSEIEVQKREHSHERPPLLPPPGYQGTGSAPVKQTAAGASAPLGGGR